MVAPTVVVEVVVNGADLSAFELTWATFETGLIFSPAIGIVDWIMVAIALGAVVCVVVVVAVVVVVKGRCGTAEVVVVVFATAAGVGTLGLAVIDGVDTFDKLFDVEGTEAGVGVLTED